MPVTYRIIEDLDLVVSTWTGDITYEDARMHNEALRDDPAFRPGMRQLSDARLARSRVTAEGVRGLARNSPWGPDARRAFVTRDDDTFGVTRMYVSQITAAGEMQLFRELNEALEWLGLSAEDVPGLE